MGVPVASASATFTADEVVVETALGGAAFRIANFNKTINLATTGAGGMDIGSAPASGFVALYAIYNPTTQASALLATNATSSAAPNVYGSANMPSGYSASALVSVWPTNPSGQFVVGLQLDREVGIGNNTVLSTSTAQASLTSFSAAAALPPNARFCRGDYTISSSSAGAGTNGVVCGSSIEVGRVAIGTTSPTASGSLTIPFPKIPIVTPQTLYYRAGVSAGTLNFVVNVCAYSF
ncbi:phage tail protein [Burkholderia cepacia]|nr:phage tail protein [Burkholderia cepacia]KVQ25865.1 phage tail protein [Burkholderia cepacia]